MPMGHHLIAGEAVSGGPSFASSPAEGPARDFPMGSPDLVDRACRAAEDAFETFGFTSRAERAALLDAIADEIDARGPEITEIGTRETAPPPRRSLSSRAHSVSEKCGVPRQTAARAVPSGTRDSCATASATSPGVMARTARGAFPPVARARSGASGVIPTAWNSATSPAEAAAAPSALS